MEAFWGSGIMKVTIEDVIKLFTVDYCQLATVMIFDEEMFPDGILLNIFTYETLRKSFIETFNVFVDKKDADKIYISIALEDSNPCLFENFKNWFLRKEK